MELTGKIIVVQPERKGVSKTTGNEWRVQKYVLETTNEQYPRKLCFEVFGSDRLDTFAIKEGELMTVSFDIDAHEYNGRWYNQIRAWKVDRNVASQPAAPVAPAAPVQAPAAAPAPEPNPVDDLPF